MKNLVPYSTIFLRKWQFLFQKLNLIFIVIFFFVWVYLKQKVYFNRPNNLEDLRQRIRFEMERCVQSVGKCQIVGWE
jgi:hypothetical protein